MPRGAMPPRTGWRQQPTHARVTANGMRCAVPVVGVGHCAGRSGYAGPRSAWVCQCSGSEPQSIDVAAQAHVPVLLDAVVGALSGAGTIVDGTLGYGGHASALLELPTTRRYVAFDMDPSAHALATARLGLRVHAESDAALGATGLPLSTATVPPAPGMAGSREVMLLRSNLVPCA